MLPTTTNKTMTSKDIADLVEARHDSVKRTIVRLANQKVIELPPTVEISTATKPTTVYIFDASHKRDTYVVVAQLSPEFTARIVDRWQELESAKPALPDFTDPVAAARAWADAKESEQKALVQLEAAKPAIEYQARVANADDCHTIDEAAKILNAGPRKLRQWMRENKILRLDGMPMQDHMGRGYFRVIEKTIPLPFGHKLHKQTLITGKGMQYLQRKIDHHLMGQEV